MPLYHLPHHPGILSIRLQINLATLSNSSLVYVEKSSGTGLGAGIVGSTAAAIVIYPILHSSSTVVNNLIYFILFKNSQAGMQDSYGIGHMVLIGLYYPCFRIPDPRGIWILLFSPVNH